MPTMAMKNILLAIGDIEHTTPASPLIERTVELARAFASKVWVVHVVPPGRTTTPFTVPREVLRGQVAGELHREHAVIQHLTQSLRDQQIDVKGFLVEGSTIKKILEEAERVAADLIVVGAHGHNLLYRVLLDGTGERLLNETARPVLFIPERENEPPTSLA
jgi:nucleotide-binding universal stress UspA family protein